MLFTLTPKGVEFHGFIKGRDLEWFNQHRDDVAEFVVLLWLCRFQQKGGRVWLEGNRLTIVGPKQAESEGKVLRQCQAAVKRYLSLRDALLV